jgi:hypothetical protein
MAIGARWRARTNGGGPSREIASRCLPFLSKVEQSLRVGDRTSIWSIASIGLSIDRAVAMVTVAGLCRTLTGFAAPQCVVG